MESSYSKWINSKTLGASPAKRNGTTMFTETRCHFRLDDCGSDRIDAVGEDFVVVTHKNLKRSFHISLFSLVEVRD